MARYAFALSVIVVACSVELAEPERGEPFTPIGGSTGTGSTGSGATGSGATGTGGLPGGGTGSGTGAGGGFGGASDSGDPCFDCNVAYCPEFNQCAQTPDCIYLNNCFSACATPQCQVNCLNTYNSVYDLYFATVSCQSLDCAAECDDPACDSCEDTNCSAPKVACLSNSECIGYSYCLGLCSDVACFQECDVLWGYAGETPYNNYVDCLEQFCPGVCI